MLRPLLLGEAPSSGVIDTPLGGRNAVRLCEAMGWDAEDAFARLTDSFETLNAIESLQSGETWDTHRAIARWIAWTKKRLAQRAMPSVVVAVGRNAAKAIGAGDREFYLWRDGQLYASVVIPHPSGRNLLWNDPATASHVRVVLTEALRRSGLTERGF